MDISAALEAAPARGTRKCVVQSWIDDIPEGTPLRAELVETIVTTDPKTPAYRSQEVTKGILARLGLHTSESAIGAHRAKRCRCFY